MRWLPIVWVLGCSSSPPPLTAADLAAAESFAWQTDETAARAQAGQGGKKLIMDFTAAWCSPCTEMDKKTFSDPRVRAKLAREYVGLRADVTAQNEADLALQKRFGVNVLPQIIVFNAAGKELFRLDRFFSPAKFLEELDSH